MSGFVERVINSLRHAVNELNKWAFRCRVNSKGKRVSDHRAVGKLLQMNGPATARLLVRCVVLVLGTDSDPVPADRRCHLPAMVEIAKQSSDNTLAPSHVDL